MLKSELLHAIQQEIQRRLQPFCRAPAIGVARRQGRRCTGLSDVQEEKQHDAAVPGSSRG